LRTLFAGQSNGKEGASGPWGGSVNWV
jgi:hypothetical protein